MFHLVFGHERRALVGEHGPRGTGPNLESTKDSSEKSLSTLEIRWGVSPFRASPTASTVQHKYNIYSITLAKC